MQLFYTINLSKWGDEYNISEANNICCIKSYVSAHNTYNEQACHLGNSPGYLKPATTIYEADLKVAARYLNIYNVSFQ